MPNKGEKWRIFEDNKVMFTLEGTKLPILSVILRPTVFVGTKDLDFTRDCEEQMQIFRSKERSSG